VTTVSRSPIPSTIHGLRDSFASVLRRALGLVPILASLACGAGAAATRSSASDPIERAVEDWLAGASSAPHDGTNLQIDLSEQLVVDGRAAFERAIAAGPTPRRRDAASALSRHPRPAEVRAFWADQLDSDDDVIRFYAVTVLADAHDGADLEAVLRAYVAHPDAAHALAVRLRDWSDRRTVIPLVELLAAEPLVAENAALSLSMSPGVPALDPEPTTTEPAQHLESGAWLEPPTSRVAPYRRWWSETGRASFAAECAWWGTFAGAPRAICVPRGSARATSGALAQRHVGATCPSEPVETYASAT
jgi:hypothetical protein